LPAGEYVYVEYYCDDLECDCREVLLQVMSANEPKKVLACINYGWEKERFYRNQMFGDAELARDIVRGCLDTESEQSEHADALLYLFQHHVLNEPYRLRLRRHYRQFREEVQRRAKAGNTP
jgi:hypothetical protein